MNHKLITDRLFYQKVLSIMLPVALQHAINMGVNMLDTMMLGQMGEVQISASSLANQYYNFFTIFCMGIIGFLAGVLCRKGLLRRSRGALCIFGALCALIIYGGLMNPVAALLARQELNWQTLVAYYITGFPVDCVHAAATCFFLLVIAEPMLEKLDRIKVKYGIVE